jgi:hypothetical protein
MNPRPPERDYGRLSRVRPILRDGIPVYPRAATRGLSCRPETVLVTVKTAHVVTAYSKTRRMTTISRDGELNVLTPPTAALDPNRAKTLGFALIVGLHFPLI